MATREGSTQDIGQAELMERLHYNPETGRFMWRKSTRKCDDGKEAGCVRRDGYRLIRIAGRLYLAHRLAWLYMHGEWPTVLMDHVDGDRQHNAIANLRPASFAENSQNRRVARSDNKQGVLGVHRMRTRGFRADIKVDGKRTHLGYFDTTEEAHEAYLAAKRQLHRMCTI